MVDEVGASEKASEIPRHNTGNLPGDEVPSKPKEDPALPEPGLKDDKPQSANHNLSVASAEGTEGPSAISEDRASDFSDSDESDASAGTDVDGELERMRITFDELEERRKQAPRRVRQANQYRRTLEKRLTILEQRTTAFDKKLRRVVNGDDELPSSDEDSEDDYIALKPGLNFQLSKGLKPVPGAATVPVTHEIDVFIGEPEAQKGERFRRRKTQLTALEDDGIDDQDITIESISERSSQTIDERRLAEEKEKTKNKHFPNRVRFNTPAIVYLLRKYFGSESSFRDDIVLRPFKPLLQNRDDILNIMSELASALHRLVDQRAKKGTEPDNGPKDTGSPEEPYEVNSKKLKKTRKSKNESKPSKMKEYSTTPDAITADEWDVVLKQLELFDESNGCHGQNIWKSWPNLSEVEKTFNALRTLLDNYLVPGHTDFRERKAKKVRFCDLWHVFQTGDIVVTKRLANSSETETHAQLGMRVLMTAGGRRVIMPKLPAPVMPSSVNLSTAKHDIEPINGVNPFIVHAHYLDFDGVKLVPVRRRIVIAPYTGERNISDLEVVPIEHAGAAADTLKERGERFIKFVLASTAPYVDCKGLELRTREEINDRVIVDMKGYLGTNPGEMPTFKEPEELDLSETSDCGLGKTCTYSCFSCYHRTSVVHDQLSDLAAYQEYIDDKSVFNTMSDVPKAGAIEPDDFIICHYRVFAYKLRSREWVHVNVKDLEPPKETEKARGFEKLVLSEDHKHILESQVREHFRKRGSQASDGNTENDMDLVRGKGQGLIILLHGAPGVGKTCTAECIADLMEKPLYPITCGDLGSSADDVEKNLKKHFTLASRWDCVMLLDEADVFLAKRMLEDLQRNSIVSVFLRMLEYYKGLLFLTTNRVGTFDEAFTSRVHISLFYPDFDKETTLKVWRTFIDQTKYVLRNSGRSKVTIAEDEIMKFAEKHYDRNENASWNGRQIRNAFHTAVAMAEFGARNKKDDTGYDDHKDATIKVGKAEFKKIARTAEEFEEYMEDTMNGTFRAKASKAGLRKDQKVQKERVREKTTKKKKKQSKSKKKSESSSGSESEDNDDSESD
ncbi:uncharacterized protein J4E88_008700 [Alternaria novae-zelandiae]|uniref:uncharacterized protein n=1 Tax=Alternaria novae-zelandiae TaxID=430562 RepID=UPI0020C2BB31|nr:uncharacterized protein J4E88_008700 [Alternaria novae-zelandiae]KAI4673644.1 hypothetical protein J4E88_008700 [Alternaria novae-zelandiae]